MKRPAFARSRLGSVRRTWCRSPTPDGQPISTVCGLPCKVSPSDARPSVDCIASISRSSSAAFLLSALHEGDGRRSGSWSVSCGSAFGHIRTLLSSRTLRRSRCVRGAHRFGEPPQLILPVSEISATGRRGLAPPATRAAGSNSAFFACRFVRPSSDPTLKSLPARSEPSSRRSRPCPRSEHQADRRAEWLLSARPMNSCGS